MPTVYVITNASCGLCNKFKDSGQYDKLLKSLQTTRIPTYTFHGKYKGDMSFPSGFPSDIRRLASFVPAIIYIPDNPRVDPRNGQILNASVYGMDIDHHQRIQPNGSFNPDADVIMNWILTLSNLKSSFTSDIVQQPQHGVVIQQAPLQAKNARLVPTSGSDGKVIPPVYLYKI